MVLFIKLTSICSYGMSLYTELSWKFVLPDIKLIRQSLMLVRPFHIIHQLVIVYLVISLKGMSPSSLDFIRAWLMLFLLMPFLFGLNDYLHHKDDEKMGRDRLFTSHTWPSWVLLASVLSLLLTMTFLAATRGVLTLAWLYAMIGCGMLYGYFKHKRQMIRTYMFRTFSGITFYMVVASYFGLSAVDWYYAIFVGLLDLFSHIAGDLRDYPLDLVGKVNTFPVRYGIRNTLFLIAGFQILSIGYFISLHRFSSWQLSIFLMCILCANTISWLVYGWLNMQEQQRHEWHHALFHGIKILTYSCIAGLMASNMHFLPIIMIFWLFSYWLYLWSDGRT